MFCTQCYSNNNASCFDTLAFCELYCTQCCLHIKTPTINTKFLSQHLCKHNASLLYSHGIETIIKCKYFAIYQNPCAMKTNQYDYALCNQSCTVPLVIFPRGIQLISYSSAFQSLKQLSVHSLSKWVNKQNMYVCMHVCVNMQVLLVFIKLFGNVNYKKPLQEMKKWECTRAKMSVKKMRVNEQWRRGIRWGVNPFVTKFLSNIMPLFQYIFRKQWP